MIAKYFDLLDRLIEQTDKGNLKWQETALEEAFIVSFPNYSVKISQQDGRDDTIDYVISILNSEGSVVDSFSDVTLSEMRPSVTSPFKKMEELFNNARRNALGADKALDDILSELTERPEQH